MTSPAASLSPRLTANWTSSTAVSGNARWQHAIKHIHAHANADHKVLWRNHAQEMARRVLARVMLQRGLKAEALAHLQFLRQLGPLGPEDEALRETLSKQSSDTSSKEGTP